MATTFQLQQLHPTFRIQTNHPPTPIHIFRSETTFQTTQQPSKHQTTMNRIEAALPSSSPKSKTHPSHHLRPRSLSFHSPISTSSFASPSSSQYNPEHGNIYAASPTSPVSSSGSREGENEMEEEDENDDEEAVSSGDEGEAEIVMQGRKRDRMTGMGYAYGDRRDFAIAEKMERLERAKRLLERYGGRC